MDNISKFENKTKSNPTSAMVLLLKHHQTSQSFEGSILMQSDVEKK